MVFRFRIGLRRSPCKVFLHEGWVFLNPRSLFKGQEVGLDNRLLALNLGHSDGFIVFKGRVCLLYVFPEVQGVSVVPLVLITSGTIHDPVDLLGGEPFSEQVKFEAVHQLEPTLALGGGLVVQATQTR